jgi:hypothetical protein
MHRTQPPAVLRGIQSPAGLHHLGIANGRQQTRKSPTFRGDLFDLLAFVYQRVNVPS